MRVERDAVAADAGAGIKRHKAERLCRSGLYNFPGIDAERIAELGHFIRSANIYCSESALPAVRIYDISGSLVFLSGVGTQIIIASHSASLVKSVVATSFRPSTHFFTSSLVTSTI